MVLSALSEIVLRDRALAESLADAPRVGLLDLTAPAGLRPFLVAGWSGPGARCCW